MRNCGGGDQSAREDRRNRTSSALDGAGVIRNAPKRVETNISAGIDSTRTSTTAGRVCPCNTALGAG